MINCNSLDEVRAGIDAIDRVMVLLIAERGCYVKQAAQFKKDAEEVSAPSRVTQVLEKVAGYAAAMGADPIVVESTYRSMIGAFIEAERIEFEKLQK